MEKEDHAEPEPTEEELAAERELVAQSAVTGDVMLRVLVNTANRFGLEMGIILTTPAGLMSGQLVGINKYLEELRSQFDQAGVEPMGKALEDGFAIATGDAEDDEPLPLHIHLVEARLFSPGQQPATIGVWRGRVAEVAGWSLGSLMIRE